MREADGKPCGGTRECGTGGVAQLGERLNGIQEVRGSIPLTSIPVSTPVRLVDSVWGEGPEKVAGIAQLVEHNLAKVGVAGSSPVSRFFDCPVRAVSSVG